jgi:hypothetical protein
MSRPVLQLTPPGAAVLQLHCARCDCRRGSPAAAGVPALQMDVPEVGVCRLGLKCWGGVMNRLAETVTFLTYTRPVTASGLARNTTSSERFLFPSQFLQAHAGHDRAFPRVLLLSIDRASYHSNC